MESTSSSVGNSGMTIIGYSYGENSIPYKIQLPGKNITLKQLKSCLIKKGNFKYFFKHACNDFGTGVVFEEISDDNEVLPLWEGKVLCIIEPMDEKHRK
ncbi:hypothetical protein AVEN_239651-1 [Araneus ventricosus]|uniref:DIX domain-containing protein n=1 Tax=Araneus ventricosus TaxID=182803 RepID=A0A4Y2CR62_ARAVE|nr:hypothetical protein AVEN_239651-1 [Araneus ventricosus]